MDKVFLVHGEHPSVPGVIIKAAATREKADEIALDLVGVIAKDANWGAPVVFPEGATLEQAIEQTNKLLAVHFSGVSLEDMEPEELEAGINEVQDTWLVEISELEVEV